VGDGPLAVGEGRGDEPLDRVAQVVGPGDGLVEAVPGGEQDRLDEPGAVPEVRVDADGRATRSARDAAHGQGVDAEGGDDLGRLGKDPGAQGAGRRGGHITMLCNITVLCHHPEPGAPTMRTSSRPALVPAALLAASLAVSACAAPSEAGADGEAIAVASSAEPATEAAPEPSELSLSSPDLGPDGRLPEWATASVLS